MRKQPFTLISGLFVAGFVNAVTVSTDPVGFITLNLTPNAMTAVSVPMLSSALHSGVIYEVEGAKITDNNASWNTGDYTTADANGNASHYIEITNHTDAGKVGAIYEITSSDGGNKTLTLGEDATGLNGGSYSVRKFQTLVDIFKDFDDSKLAKGASSDADIVYKIGAAGWEVYYLQEAPFFAGGNGWRKLGDISTDMGNVAVFPDEGLIVKRRSDGEVKVTLTGSVKTSPAMTPIVKGFNLISMSFPVDTTLKDIGLYTEDEATGMKPGSTSEADRIYLLNSAGAFEIYYFQNAPFFAGGDGWRVLGDISTDAEGTVINAGQSIVLKRNSDNEFVWNKAVPF
jgi:uncharacterized protein (TIGR02597 family)